MKIVLVRPKYTAHIITPPLGLGYLASSLKQNGIKVKLIDALKESLEQPELVEKILRLRPDAVGITCLTSFYKEVTIISLGGKLLFPSCDTPENRNICY